MPSHPPHLPTPVLWLALSTLLGDDKNVNGEMTNTEIWCYGLSPTRQGRETHPEAMGRWGRKRVCTEKVTKVPIDENKIKWQVE